MARARKTITLDEKIEKAQELLKAVEDSPRSFDEIMAFLKAEE